MGVKSMQQGLIIDTIQLKNFMSVGNVLQTVQFENGKMRIITGEDLGSPTMKRSGIGKAQPLYSKVKVKHGWKTIGELGVGDTVVTPKGTETLVTGIYPQGVKQVYNVKFSDGRVVRACKEHLWNVYTGKQEWHVANTEQLMKYLNNNIPVSVPLIDDDCTIDKRLPLPSYFLSLCLIAGEINDGGFITLKVFDDEVHSTLEYVLSEHQGLSLIKNKNGIVVFDEDNQIGKIVEEFTITPNFVDMVVNEFSITQRLDFIRGILDVYGYENDDGHLSCIFADSERHLSQLTQRLVWSLGGIAKIKKNILSDDIFNIEEEYYLTIQHRAPNTLLSSLTKKTFYDTPSLRLNVASITEHKEEECVCISILSNEKLYITDNYIITHNTTVPNALCYALYNKPVAKIKTSLLPNSTNKKGMFVRVDFRKDGTKYYIERGIKPDIFKFVEIVDGTEKERNGTQGTKSDTQTEIERILGMSHDLFTMIVTVNTINDCFMKKPLAKQRDIIEEILNIAELSRKAKILSEFRIKESKLEIDKEKIRIESQVTMKQRAEQQLTQAQRQYESWGENHNRKLLDLYTRLDSYQQIDIDDELRKHQENEIVIEQKRKRDDITRELNSTVKLIEQGTYRLNEINTMLTSFSENVCPTCKQSIDDGTHKEHEQKLINEASEFFDVLDEGNDAVKLYETQLSEIPDSNIQSTAYKSINDAYNHQHSMNSIQENIENLEKEENPHGETVDNARNMLDDSVIDYSVLELLEKRLSHQQFLLKMLTGRDSFIRKRIIDISLPVLNQNIEKYLRSTNIRHDMKFQSDLTLEIYKNGNEYDFDQLSRGEQNWAIIALNLAMRDLYEDLSGTINLVFVDELIDFGVDLGQAIDAFNILKSMSRDREKSIALITHREELFEKADDILYTLMENDFTSYEVRQN